MSAVAQHPPIVVGGTAEQFWSRDHYRETDLDLCGPISASDEARLVHLGFEPVGRYWELDGEFSVAVEFPDDTLAGDPSRVLEHVIQDQRIRVIGVDDLYLDRLRHATSRPDGDEDRLASGYAILATRMAEMDFSYIERQIEGEVARNRLLFRMPEFHGHLVRGIRAQRTFPEQLRLLRAGLARGRRR